MHCILFISLSSYLNWPLGLTIPFTHYVPAVRKTACLHGGCIAGPRPCMEKVLETVLWHGYCKGEEIYCPWQDSFIWQLRLDVGLISIE